MVISPPLGCTTNNANIAIMYDNLPFCDNYISIGFIYIVSFQYMSCRAKDRRT